MTALDETPELLRRQFVDGSVWYDEDTVHPHDALLRLLVERGPFRDAVARAIPSLLASDDARHRTGAVALLGELGADLGADAMASWVEAGEAGLRGVRASWTLEHEDLEACAAIAIANAARPGDRVACAWLRRVAKERPWRVHVLAAVARLDLSPSKGASVTAIHFDPPPKIDFAAREIHVRLAYCGAAWSGRSTSLARVRDRIAAPLRTDLVARTGSTDVRTMFSFLVLDRARHGMKVRVELATIPSARLHGPEVLPPLLDGVHGVIYVLDSDKKRRDAAVDYRAWLDAELARSGTALARVPHVWQINQRDPTETSSVAALVTDDAPVIAGSALASEAPLVAVDTLVDLVLKRHGLLRGASR